MGSGVVQAQRQQILYLTFNFFSTVAVTFINKLVFSRVNFGFVATLCNIHFAITWLGVETMRRLRLFEPLPKRPSLRDPHFLVMVLVLGTVTPLNNSALKLNSMGFYQIVKLMLTPAVVLLEYILDHKTVSWQRSACLFVVCSFVLLSSKADLDLNPLGMLYSILWIPLAATYKVQWGRLRKRYSASTPAMMHATLPYAMLVQATMAPLVDPQGLWQYEWTVEAIFWITISGVAAFLVNFSGFLVMGNIGALAHVLLGQLKTSVIMVGAYFLFGSRYASLQLWGAAGAVLAIVLYTHVTVSERKYLKEGADGPNDQESDSVPRDGNASDATAVGGGGGSGDNDEMIQTIPLLNADNSLQGANRV